MSVHFAAVHDHNAWRKHSIHQSLEAAINGKDGAKNLLRQVGRIAGMWKKWGDVKCVFVWEDSSQAGYAFRLAATGGGRIDSASPSADRIRLFNGRKACSDQEIAQLFASDTYQPPDSHQPESPGYVEPIDTDERLLTAIWTRRGQPEFRAALLTAYGSRCAITGCDVVDALEAAHIIPFANEKTYSLSNGLLLRGDIHTLFDLFLLAVNPDKATVHIAPQLVDSYGTLEGTKLALPSAASAQPDRCRLQRHYNEWSKRWNSGPRRNE